MKRSRDAYGNQMTIPAIFLPDAGIIMDKLGKTYTATDGAIMEAANGVDVWIDENFIKQIRFLMDRNYVDENTTYLDPGVAQTLKAKGLRLPPNGKLIWGGLIDLRNDSIRDKIISLPVWNEMQRKAHKMRPFQSTNTMF